MTIRRGRRNVQGFLHDFQEFALKGNVIDLAIAVVIGGAFGKIVTSFVENIIMPLVSVVLPAGNWREAGIQLAPGKVIGIGSFLGSIVDFVIIALVLYLVIRAVTRSKREAEVATTEEAPLDPVVQSQSDLIHALDRLTQTLETQGR
jgi:large conductance mechanosensitive channel